jgi:hypothetical protein
MTARDSEERHYHERNLSQSTCFEKADNTFIVIRYEGLSSQSVLLKNYKLRWQAQKRPKLSSLSAGIIAILFPMHYQIIHKGTLRILPKKVKSNHMFAETMLSNCSPLEDILLLIPCGLKIVCLFISQHYAMVQRQHNQ